MEERRIQKTSFRHNRGKKMALEKRNTSSSFLLDTIRSTSQENSCVS